MTKRLTTTLATLSLVTGLATAAPAIAVAQQDDVPVYNSWQTQWDQDNYDHRHVILGTVVKFWPYRVVVQRDNGDQQTIDLTNGTTIRPTGATPNAGDHIAIIGYYSNGTFIANRVVLR
jgi:hypothetical protein